LVLLGVSVALNATAFVFVFRSATARDLSIRDVAFGAISAALFWQLLQSFGVLYVRHVVKNASETNAVFAFVLGLVAFLYLISIAVVLCVEIDVVNVDKLWPRSLMTPFTDDVVLTPADKRAYRTQAEAQRMKGFERVQITFDPVIETVSEVEPEPAPDLEKHRQTPA
jgi:membrane protein